VHKTCCFDIQGTPCHAMPCDSIRCKNSYNTL
jgi:hypothetical protein